MESHYNTVRFYRSQHIPTDEDTVNEDLNPNDMAVALKIDPTASIQHWNPKKQPLRVAGSIFDVDFLCQWMLKWTSYHYGPQHETTDVARHISALAADLDAKLDRAYAAVPSYRVEQRDPVGFIYRGDSLWERFQTLILECSKSMQPKDNDGYPPVNEGADAATEFVSALFDSNKQRAKTDKLILKISRWNEEFDSLLEEFLLN